MNNKPKQKNSIIKLSSLKKDDGKRTPAKGSSSQKIVKLNTTSLKKVTPIPLSNKSVTIGWKKEEESSNTSSIMMNLTKKGSEIIMSTISADLDTNANVVETVSTPKSNQQLAINRRLSLGNPWDPVKLKQSYFNTEPNLDMIINDDDKTIQFKVAARFRPFNVLESVIF
jgi:hypothetical protein